MLVWYLLFIVAAGFTIVNLALHVLTFTSIPLDVDIRHYSTFDSAAMIVAAPAIIVAALAIAPYARSPRNAWRILWWKVSEMLPRWLIMLCVAVGTYAVLNFVICLILNRGGTPSIQQGRYVLEEHGRIIVELTRDQFRTHQAYEFRLASGHLCAFCWLATSIYYACLREVRSIKEPRA